MLWRSSPASSSLAAGHGSKIGYADVTGFDEFFVDAYNTDTDTDNDSLIASL